MAGNGSKRNSGYIARTSGSGMNKNAGGGKGKGKRSGKPLGFDLSDTESRIAFYTFIVISVLLAALLIAGFALGIARCGSEVVSDTDAVAEQAGQIVSYADGVSYSDIEGIVSPDDIISYADVG